MNKKEIEDLFYIKKEYSKIKKELKNPSETWSFNILGKIALQEKKLEKAKDYFELSCNFLGLAYCHFYKNEIKLLESFIEIKEDNLYVKKENFMILNSIILKFIEKLEVSTGG